MQDKVNISSKLDLGGLCEVEDATTGMVLRCTFYYIDTCGVAWFGQVHGVRKYDLTVEDLRQNLKRVPDWKVYPTTTPHITVLPLEDVDSEHFVKQPKILCLDDSEEAELIPRMFIAEAETLEFLRQHQHPNVVRYYGCTLSNNRVNGIVLKKYPATLQYRYEDDPRDFDIQKCLQGVQAGLDHLHSFSLAHNDINPMNIALDETDNPVILDFGSCQKFGVPLVSGGTPGWTDDEEDGTSSRCHDEAGVDMLRSWLQNQHSKRVHERRLQQAPQES